MDHAGLLTDHHKVTTEDLSELRCVSTAFTLNVSPRLGSSFFGWFYNDTHVTLLVSCCASFLKGVVQHKDLRQRAEDDFFLHAVLLFSHVGELWHCDDPPLPFLSGGAGGGGESPVTY